MYPARESLVSDIQAEDGINHNLFLQCTGPQKTWILPSLSLWVGCCEDKMLKMVCRKCGGNLGPSDQQRRRCSYTLWPRTQEVGHFPRSLPHSKTGKVINHCDLWVKRSGIFLAVSIIQRQVGSLITVTSGSESRGRAFSSQSPSFKDG
jgi:hypothetical protein